MGEEEEEEEEGEVGEEEEEEGKSDKERMSSDLSASIDKAYASMLLEDMLAKIKAVVCNL